MQRLEPSRALALLVAVLMLLVLWAGLVQPFLGGNQMVSTYRLLAEQKRIAERQPQLTAQKAELAQALPSMADFLVGASPALAAADLQGRMAALVKRGSIASVEPIPFADDEGFHRAGLRLKLSVPQDALPNLLHDIEDSEPRLFIAAMTAKANGEDVILSVDLYGYLANEPGKAGIEAAPVLPPLASYSDLLRRPLFMPGRRSAATAQLASSSLRLTGLVAEAGHTVALIRTDERKSEVRIGLGASLNGWQVSAIDAKGLELTAGSQHFHVGLKQGIPPSPE
jgi:hypothetical protein